MPGTAIDPQIAAAALSLQDLGYGSSEIARRFELAESTVRYILGRHGKWGEVAEGPVFARLRSEQNRHIEVTARAMAAAFMAEACKPEKIAKASTFQLIGSFGLLLDKAQLLAGLPTEIHANLNVNASVNLDKLMDALSNRLVKSNAVVVDQTDKL